MPYLQSGGNVIVKTLTLLGLLRFASNRRLGEVLFRIPFVTGSQWESVTYVQRVVKKLGETSGNSYFKNSHLVNEACIPLHHRGEHLNKWISTDFECRCVVETSHFWPVAPPARKGGLGGWSERGERGRGLLWVVFLGGGGGSGGRGMGQHFGLAF